MSGYRLKIHSDNPEVAKQLMNPQEATAEDEVIYAAEPVDTSAE